MPGVLVFVIVSVWALLLGPAVVGRKVGLSRIGLLAVLAAAFAAGAFIVLGVTWKGWFGAFGMLLPFAVALVLGRMPPRE